MWRGLIASIQFLTIIPSGSTQAFEAHRALPFFPICGLIIGSLLAGVDYLGAMIWPSHAVAVVDMVFLVVITGALHLDGLADTADGLYGRRTVKRVLEIMKDSRVGAIGVVTVICCLAVKWAGLSGIQHLRPFWLFMVPALSRATVIFAIRFLPYGRPDGGTGHSFFQRPIQLIDYWSLGLLAGVILITTVWGFIWVSIGIVCLTASILIYYRIKINCITGDMLGAMIEITESGLFLLLAASNRLL
jgi:adenosylcobinamide-GDP ribazoletransferase